MIKLKFLKTTHNLLTKLYIEKLDPFLLLNFLTWYTSWPMEVDKWRLQLDHVTLSQSGLWSVHCILDTWLKCWCHLSSPSIKDSSTSSSFNSIRYVEVKISWGGYIPPLNHICIQNLKYEGLRHDSNFQNHEKESKKSNWIDFGVLFSINELHLKITWSYRFFSCKVLFPNWILQVIKKLRLYLEIILILKIILREWPKTCN